MKAILLPLLACLMLLGSMEARPSAAPPPIFGIVRAAVVKAIKAMDLKIQKLQNKTIWLQNTQKQIENALSKAKLTEIADWAQKQKDLYRQYYDELKQVKAIVSQYQRIREITAKQARMLSEYQRFWGLLQQDGHFSPDELSYMEDVYQGILSASLENMDHIFLVIESFSTSMSDAQRLELINQAADRIGQNHDDLKRFNSRNVILALQRAKDRKDAEMMKRLYGVQN